MESLSLIKESHCLGACPTCCGESLEELNAKAEAGLRNRALTLSGVVAVIVMGAHVVFSYQGKLFPMPDIAWVIILAPWGGAGMGKLSEVFFGKGKK